MKAKSREYRYLEWLSAEEMHEGSKNWFSELKFIRDEQLFLNNLVTSYTLELVDINVFENSKKVIEELQKAEKALVPLFKKVQAHENQLTIMVDDIDQLEMEKAYIQTHKALLVAMQDYTTDYRDIKKRLFEVISAVLRKAKQKKLSN